MLDEIGPLVTAGFALHWLHDRTKRPIGADWSQKPRNSLESLRRSYVDGRNVGVRLGEPSKIGTEFLYLIDLDIREDRFADDAMAKLAEIMPESASLPTVQSGSGGLSRHFYFLCSGRFPSKKVAHSDTFFHDSEGKKHWSWEIELFGTGKQAVIPPSIHPDTGQPYRWLREFDLDDLEMGLGPSIDPSRVAQWVPEQREAAPQDEDDLIGFVRNQPLDITEDEVKSTLAALPLADWCEDRDGWLQVGMALHHQFEGSDEGFKVWCEFSKQSDKFNERDQKVVWRSFKGKPESIRFPTLIKAANVARAEEEWDEGDDGFDEDDDEDLIGTPTDGAPAAQNDDQWIKLIDRNQEGAIKPTLHNVSLIVANDSRTKGLVGLNEFTQEICQIGKPGTKVWKRKRDKPAKQLAGPIWQLEDPVNGNLWSKTQDNALRALIEAPTGQGGYGIKVADRDLQGGIDLAASENAFHPVRNFLSGLKWDGKTRAERLFCDYLGSPNTPYIRQVARTMLVAAVTRVFEPGHKFDFAVILEGSQGKRKSTFIETLAVNPAWFSELHTDFSDDKACVEAMQGSWIMEIPELSGFSRADRNRIKAFISTKADKVRLAYERRAAVFKRQCVFIGSTNDREYLRDDTGGRRFWPVETFVETIDTVRLAESMPQIWAEAVVLYHEMRAAQPKGNLPLYLSDAEASADALELQESRRIETADDAMLGQLLGWLDQPVAGDFDDAEPKLRDKVCLIQIAAECFGHTKGDYVRNAPLAQQLSRVMRRVPGWLQGGKHRFGSYGQQRSYFRNLAYRPD